MTAPTLHWSSDPLSPASSEVLPCGENLNSLVGSQSFTWVELFDLDLRRKYDQEDAETKQSHQTSAEHQHSRQAQMPPTMKAPCLESTGHAEETGFLQLPGGQREGFVGGSLCHECQQATGCRVKTSFEGKKIRGRKAFANLLFNSPDGR